MRVNVRSDVGAFEEAVQARRYGEALALSGAPLLAGVRAPNMPAWDDWLEQRRGLIGEQRRAALRGEAARLEGAGDLSGALELTRTLTRLDPLDELSYRAAMRLHYRQGELEAAQACFAECRHVMMRELGVEPLSETLELAHLIEKSRAHALTPRVTLPLQLLRPPHLVGREEVWARLEAAQRAGQAVFLAGARAWAKRGCCATSRGVWEALFSTRRDRATCIRPTSSSPEEFTAFSRRTRRCSSSLGSSSPWRGSCPSTRRTERACRGLSPRPSTRPANTCASPKR